MPDQDGNPTAEEFAELQRKLAEEQEGRRGDIMRAAKLEALQEFPQANQELLQMFTTTNVDDIKEFARKSHEAALAAAPAPVVPSPSEPPPAQGTPPLPVPASTDVPNQQDLVAARIAELRQKMEARTIDPAERDELANALERQMWNSHVGAVRELARTQ